MYLLFIHTYILRSLFQSTKLYFIALSGRYPEHLEKSKIEHFAKSLGAGTNHWTLVKSVKMEGRNRYLRNKGGVIAMM